MEDTKHLNAEASDAASRYSESLPAYSDQPQRFYDTWNFREDKTKVSLIVFGKDGLKAWFSHDCEVREERSQKTLYHLEGNWKLVGMDLRLTKGDENGLQIARVKKGFLGALKLTVTMADGWQTTMDRSGLFSNSFSFRAPNGETFKWKSRMTSLTTVRLIKTSSDNPSTSTNIATTVEDEDTEDTGKQIVAEWQECFTFSSKAVKLVIEPEYAFLTDLILTTALGWEALAVEEYRKVTVAGGDKDKAVALGAVWPLYGGQLGQSSDTTTTPPVSHDPFEPTARRATALRSNSVQRSVPASNDIREQDPPVSNLIIQKEKYSNKHDRDILDRNTGLKQFELIGRYSSSWFWNSFKLKLFKSYSREQHDLVGTIKFSNNEIPLGKQAGYKLTMMNAWSTTMYLADGRDMVWSFVGPGPDYHTYTWKANERGLELTRPSYFQEILIVAWWTPAAGLTILRRVEKMQDIVLISFLAVVVFIKQRPIRVNSWAKDHNWNWRINL
ncbi:hypothetical protein OIO90_004373 [Microbotryomycetes sp. JL221]|nr:hypothetical protein OIO90_004373 [Microbotryomycetes sp. JL221]